MGIYSVEEIRDKLNTATLAHSKHGTAYALCCRPKCGELKVMPLSRALNSTSLKILEIIRNPVR